MANDRDRPHRRGRYADDRLRREFPEFEDVIKAAGPSHGIERHWAAIQQLARRFELVREQLDAATPATKRKR